MEDTTSYMSLVSHTVVFLGTGNSLPSANLLYKGRRVEFKFAGSIESSPPLDIRVPPEASISEK